MDAGSSPADGEGAGLFAPPRLRVNPQPPVKPSRGGPVTSDGVERLAQTGERCHARGMKDVADLADEVEDERSFIAFLDALAQDFGRERAIEAERPSSPYSSGALGWEHDTIDAMLEAAAAWGASSGEAWQAGEDRNPWRRCARIILAGKLYE